MLIWLKKSIQTVKSQEKKKKNEKTFTKLRISNTYDIERAHFSIKEEELNK